MYEKYIAMEIFGACVHRKKPCFEKKSSFKAPFHTTVALICNEMFVQLPSERKREREKKKIDNLLKLWKVGECGSSKCCCRIERD